jgi:hypothetical protein
MAAFGEYKRTGKKVIVAYLKTVPSIRLEGLEDTTKNLHIIGATAYWIRSSLEHKSDT